MRKRPRPAPVTLLLAALAAVVLFAANCGGDDDGTQADDGDGAQAEPDDDGTQADPDGDGAQAEPDDDGTQADPDGDGAQADPDDGDGAQADPDDDGTQADDGFKVGLVFDVGGEGDQSFNDSAVAGIERAAEELGIAYTKATPNQDGSDREELLRLAAEDSDAVIAVGFLFEEDAVRVAADNPGVRFGVVDTPMLDYESGQPYGENVSGLVFAEHQGSFLVGAAAALKSQTGVVGFIGGVAGAGGLIERFEAGYETGARAVKPDIEILSQYITEAPDTTGWSAPDRAKEIALTMYDTGADIIYHAAGRSGGGLFEAAKQRSDESGSKVWGIGVDSDQYHTVDAEVRDYVLTSMLKRVDTSIFELLKAAMAGTAEAGPTTYDLSVDGVGYSTSGGFVDDIVAQLEDFKARIVAGEIDVPDVPAAQAEAAAQDASAS